MLSRLRQHHAFLSDLSQDGWSLVEPVKNDFACLANSKPADQRRVAVASWEWRSAGGASSLGAPFPRDGKSGFSTD